MGVNSCLFRGEKDLIFVTVLQDLFSKWSKNNCGRRFSDTRICFTDSTGSNCCILGVWKSPLMYDCPPLHTGQDPREWVAGGTHRVCVCAQAKKCSHCSVSPTSYFYCSSAARSPEEQCWRQRQCPGSDRHQSYFEGSRGLGIRACQYRRPCSDPTRSQWTSRRVSIEGFSD